MIWLAVSLLMATGYIILNARRNARERDRLHAKIDGLTTLLEAVTGAKATRTEDVATARARDG